MDQSSKEPSQIQGSLSINRHTTRKPHLKMDDACIMEMTSSKLWKDCEVTENPPKRDMTSHSLDSLARTTSRAKPNEYETFYKTPVSSSQPSLSQVLTDEIKNEADDRTEQRRTEVTDSDGLCTSDSFTASSEFSEPKYDVPSMLRPTSRLAQRHQEIKEQYLAEQQHQQRRSHEQYPRASSSNVDGYAPFPSFYDPEKSSMFEGPTRFGSCRKYEDYPAESRRMRLADSRNSVYESWDEDTAPKRRSRDGTLPSAYRSQNWVQREQRPSQNEIYRHKNRKSTPSPNAGCWSTNTSFSYAHRPPSMGLGSTTTLTSYVDEYQPPRHHNHHHHHRDPNRPPRKHRSRPPSVEDLSSVTGVHKKRTSEQQSISSRLGNDRYARQSERKSRHDRNLDGKSIGRMSVRSGQLRSNEQSSTLSSQHLATIDDIDFASIYGMNTRRLMGPVLLVLLVLIMLLALGLAIYFALGRTKDAEFSTANIRFRIINSTFGEDLNYLSKPTFERLSSEYCRQMDRYYLRSVLKKRYRGCDVISLKRQFINFTLYFTEKEISGEQVGSVIETSVKFVNNPTGTRTAIIDKFEIEFSRFKIDISKKTEKLDFDKIRLTPEVKPKTKSISPPQSKDGMINMNKNAEDVNHKVFIDINNVHPEEKHHINKAPKKILTKTTRKKSTITTIPRKTTKTTTIATNKQIVRENNDNDGITEHDSATKEMPLADPCITQKTGKLIPHPVFCEKFYQCVHGTGIVQSCQKGTWFDPKLNVCGLRPKGVECSRKLEMDKSRSSSPTAKISTTLTTPKMASSSSSLKPVSSLANEAPTPFLFAADISPADTVIELKPLSGNRKVEMPRQNGISIGVQLELAPLKFTTLNPFEGPIQAPCTTSQMDQYHPHPDGCNHFQHCVNGKPEEKNCPSDFVFDFESASCVRNTSSFICPDFFPCRRTGSGNYYPHPYHCDLYIQCEFGKEKMMECSSDLVFDPIVKTCVAKLKTKDWKCPEERKGRGKIITNSVP